MSSCSLIPVRGDVLHEEDAGVHVQVESRRPERAVYSSHGAASVVRNPQRETEAQKEVGSGQILQVDCHTRGVPLGFAEVHANRDAVQNQTQEEQQSVGCYEERLRYLLDVATGVVPQVSVYRR